MAFDWTSVDAGSMANRGSDGRWRQGAVAEGSTDGLDLAAWLRELWSWGFDSLTLEAEAAAWLERMENEHLILVTRDAFERARCGLDDEPGHMHVRYCAGPTAAERRWARRAS